MHQKNHTKSWVKVVQPYDFSLDETLRPWWTLTRYGVLLDWCHQHNDHERPLVNVARYIGVGLCFLFFCLITVFEFIQMIISILTMTSVGSVVPFLIWFISMPVTVYLHYYFVFKRQSFLSLFEDWKNLEKTLAIRNCHKDFIPALRRVRVKIFAMKLVLGIGILIGMTFIVAYNPYAHYLLTYYRFFQQVVTVPVTSVIHISNIALILLLTNLADAVPGLIFYHAGFEVRVLQEEIQHLFATLRFSANSTKLVNASGFHSNRVFATKLRQICDCFEIIRKFVFRANTLFGLPVLLNHGIKFFLTLASLYSTVIFFRTTPVSSGVYFAILVGNLYDFVHCTLLSAQPYCDCERLRAVLGGLLSEYWDLVPKEERDLLVVFLSRLQSDPLAAIPGGLYKITPSILLTMTSLTMTYLVILLQSN